MEWLIKILGEDAADKLEAIKKELPKHYALKNDFNSRGEEIKSLKEKLEETETSLTKLKDDGGTELEDYKKQVETATKELADYKAGTEKREKTFKIKSKMRDLLSKSINPDAVDLALSAFDFNDMNLNDAGDIVDGQSKVDKFVEGKPGLKLITNVGGTPPEDKKTNELETDYSKMSDEDYYKSLAEKK